MGALLIGAAIPCLAAYEQEQLALETQLQQRIDSILAKTLPPNSYLITVKVEMEDKAKPTSVRSSNNRRDGNNNPFLKGNRFILPGVPEKKEFGTTPEPSTNETVVNSFSAETLVRKITISILVAPDISAEQIRAIRDVISASIPFNPLRGDELDIQNSTLLRSSVQSTGSGTASSAVASTPQTRSNTFAGMFDRTNAPMLFFLGAISTALVIFIAFLFGPVRAFLNRLLMVLPRVGEQAAYAVSNAPKTPTTATGTIVGQMTGAGNGGRSKANGENEDLPFHFIREEQLNKLPILFKQLAPAQSALVLAYLPPEWASRVLNTMETVAQSAVMRELSQAREVPPEVVKEIETQIKNKLPYLVGGVDWIQSVYQLTHPQTQRALLGTLNQQSPELAQSLRQKTFFFEDIGAIQPGMLRVLVQEVGYPVTALCLRDEKPEFREALLRKLPVAMREIVQQELEMPGDDKAAIMDAKVRIVDAARRMLLEGRLSLPERRS